MPPSAVTGGGFASLGLSSTTLRSLARMGYEEAAPVQKQAIPLGLNSGDVIIQSKSGSGKTCAFGVIVCESTIPGMEQIQSIVIAPSREIVNQIRDEMLQICHYSRQVISTVGEFTCKQKQAAEIPDILIGTSNQVYLLFRQGHVPMCSDDALLVMDEADIMLDSSRDRKYLTYITRGLHYLCNDVKLILSSATLPPHVLPYAEELLEYIEPKGSREFSRATLCRSDTIDPAENALLTHITHAICVLPKEANGDIPWGLEKLLEKERYHQCIVFCTSVPLVKMIAAYLRDYVSSSCRVVETSEDHSIAERSVAMELLSSQEHGVVVATDEVFSRGVDGPLVDLVINIGLPETKETYLHRSGRCGRFGRPGTCITLLEGTNELDEIRFLYVQLGVPFETVVLEQPAPIAVLVPPKNCYYFMSNHPFAIHTDVEPRKRELRKLHASVWGFDCTADASH
ncbi:DEAD box ATP-dependent RNA helicase, putative [Perkinsus marinus ATCC 50983]|uniref:ATP-dependent RNA helicase n=1 Tax=Perkinsus marinus (strain ATCC 50983 / TXsc) TaxID=423536 RepID=C5KTH9_PERM5|nr:DEAD box ATP-dependent RNA helicase, putative [Perkinsus marinus ATCC 50983]EER12158.1 DEAD box ATP-dependent RNA helicase, putative [Perkinsus marinus ATCC 50983]|eukprot:XP_002780363.1 DEAD box ATP-dependent RNA helicase, putative [Perkinsus marinus ATCC 50983]